MDKKLLYDQDPEDYFKTPKELDQKDRAAEEEREKQKALLNCYHRLFSTADGQKVLDHLSVTFGESDACFHPGSSDITYYALGRRSVILHIREQLRRSIK